MDHTLNKEFEDAYDNSYRNFSVYWQEANRDVEYSIGKQWNSRLEAYLKSQGREALVFNKMHRILKLISGYQRKSRLSLRVDPVEGADEQTAGIFSADLMWHMQYNNGYNIMSDAFELGPLIQGLNLVELCLDYTSDPIDGDIYFKRKPYNRFLLDPNFQERDLRDCDYVICRDNLTKSGVETLLPDGVKLKDIVSRGLDTKFPYDNPDKDRSGKYLYKYDRFWVRTTTPKKILVDRQTGKMTLWKGNQKRLKEFIDLFGYDPERLTILEKMETDVELRIVVEGQTIWKGSDPFGIRDYPFVMLLGFFTPEAKKMEDRIQGIVRCMRDPQDEVNKRRSKMLDIIDSQISSGWIAREDVVKNKEQLYQSGQGQVIWISEDTALPISEVIQEKRAADIPPGLFQLTELFDRDILEIPGANQELLGMPDHDDVEVAAVLAKLRQASGLTVLQDLFDNYRVSKKILGQKLIKAIQANHSPRKVMAITGKQPTKEFYNRNFGKYDCVPVEGVLTDTQRQHHYAQLFAMKKAGAPIPWSSIIKAWPLEAKDELMVEIQKAEQAQMQQAQQGQMLNQLQIQLNQAMMKANMAKMTEHLAQAEENRAEAAYDRAKTVTEVQGLDLQNLMAAIQIIQMMQNGMQPQQQKQIGPA